jgi:alanine dehydrogenase
MVIGVPKEIHRYEHRVGLTPSAAAQLTRRGHEVVVEQGAGVGAHFLDHDYEKCGARIVYDPDEVYQRADLVTRVGLLADEELDLLKPGSTICAFHHLAVAPRRRIERLMELGVTLIGYEIVRDAAGRLPVLFPLSEVAGQMAVHVGAHYLQNGEGGRGILLGNVPGVPPPTVLILGAGTVGGAAAREAVATGAHAIVFDSDLSRLRGLNHELGSRVVTALSGHTRLERYTTFADVVIGAVLDPGNRAPRLITEEMVRAMRPGSVVLDVAIDQGGCVATSRPTTLEDPVFILHDVVHYCVPNMTANVARTATRVLTNAAVPYLLTLADRGVDGALAADPGLAQGVYLHRGRMVSEWAGATAGIPATPIAELLEPRGNGS